MSQAPSFSLQQYERSYEEAPADLIEFRLSTERSTMLPASSLRWVDCEPQRLVICFSAALVTVTGTEALKLREPLQTRRLKWVAARKGSGIEEIVIEQKEEPQDENS